MIVDLSHPYAKVVSENARFVSEELGIEYKRYARRRAVHGGDHIYLNSMKRHMIFYLILKGQYFYNRLKEYKRF